MLLAASSVTINIRVKLQFRFVIDGIYYKDNTRTFNRKEPCMQKHLYNHFQSEGHKGFLNEEKTDRKDLKKERYLIQTLEIIESYGLNIAETVTSTHT